MSSSGFRGTHRNELRAKNEATRRIHQGDAVEVPVTFSPNRRLVETEREPGFVDRKLFRMKHEQTVPVTPNAAVQRPRASNGCVPQAHTFR